MVEAQAARDRSRRTWTRATFVYTGKVHTGEEEGDSREDGDDEWAKLGDCWILGDKLQSTSSEEAVLDAFAEKAALEQTVSDGDARAAYTKTVGENGLKRLAVEIATFAWSEDAFETWQAEASVEAQFYEDVCLRLRKKNNSTQDPLKNPGCKFHDHGRDKPCYKTMF